MSTSTISFILIFSLAMIPLGYFLRQRDRNRIRTYLMEHNCELLKIVWLSRTFKTPWYSGGYEVTFVNKQNELFRANCYSVHPNHLSWMEPVFMYSVNSWQLEQLKQSGQPIPDQMPFEAKSDRETIIDGLTSSFKFERIWAVKELLEIEIVDWQMHQLLNELATGDEEPEVREAATKIMKKLEIIEEG